MSNIKKSQVEKWKEYIYQREKDIKSIVGEDNFNVWEENPFIEEEINENEEENE